MYLEFLSVDCLWPPPIYHSRMPFLNSAKSRRVGNQRRIGFVTCKNENSMWEAIEGMKGQHLDGCNITVDEAWTHSCGRGGGGRGVSSVPDFLSPGVTPTPVSRGGGRGYVPLSIGYVPKPISRGGGPSPGRGSSSDSSDSAISISSPVGSTKEIFSFVGMEDSSSIARTSIDSSWNGGGSVATVLWMSFFIVSTTPLALIFDTTHQLALSCLELGYEQ